MALSEQRRQQLDDIVLRMEGNNEPVENIQFVVDDFKSKYEAEQPEPVSRETPDPQQDRQQQRAEPVWDKQTGEIVPENILPYYKQGIQNLAKKPYETLFPGSASVEGKGVIPTVKRNALGAFDVLGWPDRAIDYASGGAFERGKETIGGAIDKIPGTGKISDLVRGNLKTGVDIATSPSTYVGAGTIKNLLTKETPETIAKAMAKKSGVDAYIKKGVDKGIKPTVRNKSNYTAMKNFEAKAGEAVKTIAENKNNLNLVDEFGEKIPRPRSAAEMAQAIEQTKKSIYKEYHQMAVEAGEKGAQANIGDVIDNLNKVSNDIKYNPQIRDYAREMVDEVSELQGAAPEIIEERIKDLNQSLAGFYDGRVSKAKAQIDASVANQMREQLDKSIAEAAGEGYQALKNKYGALKAIEKEVNHRAIVNARKASKGVADLTDIFTGGDLIGGVLTMNPAMIGRGVAGRGIKEIYKAINNPDRYIDNMFKKAFDDYSPQAPKPLPTPKKTSSLSNQSGATGRTIREASESVGKKINPPGKSILGNNRGSIGDAAKQTKTDNFKNWFGDWEKAPEKASKVVDESGKPLVVYHGTGKDFSVFDMTKIGTENYSDWGKGIYVTPRKENANSYREEALANADEIAGKLWGKMQELEKKVTWKNGTPTYPEEHDIVLNQWRLARKLARNKAEGKVMDLYVSVKNPYILPYQSTADPTIAKYAITKGHDGIFVLTPNGKIDEIVVFSPTQIKSATGNSGAFSKTIDDIRGSSALKTMDATGAIAGAGLTGITIGAAAKNKNKRK